jgi:pimeloyl-ACP methyl ester carboxylesterase
MAKIVFPLHGIRTLGNWQRTFADLAKRRGWTCPLDGWWFGRFSLLQFLTPFARSARITWFRERYTASLREYQRTIDGGQGRRPSIVGHSFGTYIIGYALMKYKDMRFDKIVLCGSILPRSFPWDELIERGQVNAVRNDVGLQDFWASVCCWVVPGTGSAGSRGFIREHERLVQHRHNLNHGEFFDPYWMNEHWMTFLEQSFPPVERLADTTGAVTIPPGDHPIASRIISGLLTSGFVAGLVLLAWLLVGLVVSGQEPPVPKPTYHLVDAEWNEPIERYYTLWFSQGETSVAERGSATRPVPFRQKKPWPTNVDCEGYEYDLATPGFAGRRDHQAKAQD